MKSEPTKFRKKKGKEKQRKPADKFHEQNEMSTVNLPYTLLLSYVVVVVVAGRSLGLVVGFWADYFLF